MRRLLLACCVATFATAASAQYCTIADPTGTPLNVRTYPNGPILGALHNGTTVQMLRSTLDTGGRPWAYVAPQGPGRSGWVFGAYLACGRALPAPSAVSPAPPRASPAPADNDLDLLDD